jgi:hypothetical protein
LMRRGLIVGVLAFAFAISYSERLWSGEKPSLEEKKTAAPNKSERPQHLETVGALAAGQLYQTYLTIGLLADGVARGAYDEKDARSILQTARGLVELQDKHLARVGKLDLTPADREALNKLRKLGTLLRRQAEELDAYWKTDDKDHAAKYEKTRQEAWTDLSSLLRLKK